MSYKNSRLPPDWTASPISFFRDAFPIYTIFLFGAAFQCVLSLLLGRLALLLTTCLVAAGYFMPEMKERMFQRVQSQKGSVDGRFSVLIPRADGVPSEGPGEEGFTVFVLAMRSARGPFASGCKEMSEHFNAVWEECFADRATNGFLGKTQSMVSSEDDCSNTTTWITYWRDLASLTEFAVGDVHLRGVQWYLVKAMADYPHLGIYHETYTVPRGHWEAIGYNIRPFGLADMRIPVVEGSLRKPETNFYRPIVSATGPAWNTLRSRMGFK